MADSERVAELKRKMQEAAQRAKAEASAAEASAPAAPAPAAPAPAAPAPAAPAPAASEAVAVAQAPAAEVAAPIVAESSATPAPAEVAPRPVSEARTQPVAALAASAATSSNGASNGAGAVAGALDDTTYVPQVLTPEELAKREMNRREFLTYAWGGALLLVAGASGVGMFQFLYPRFKAGEFGGKFFLGPVSGVPATDAPPKAYVDGKFWLVNTTDEGVKALYMVCTHLGCLYKWEPSTVRFECPCHGSKFSREGFYIEGPAPRSLDRFETTEDNGEIVVDTGAKITGSPSSESPARAAA